MGFSSNMLLILCCWSCSAILHWYWCRQAARTISRKDANKWMAKYNVFCRWRMIICWDSIFSIVCIFWFQVSKSSISTFYLEKQDYCIIFRYWLNSFKTWTQKSKAPQHISQHSWRQNLEICLLHLSDRPFPIRIEKFPRLDHHHNLPFPFSMDQARRNTCTFVHLQDNCAEIQEKKTWQIYFHHQKNFIRRMFRAFYTCCFVWPNDFLFWFEPRSTKQFSNWRRNWNWFVAQFRKLLSILFEFFGDENRQSEWFELPRYVSRCGLFPNDRSEPISIGFNAGELRKLLGYHRTKLSTDCFKSEHYHQWRSCYHFLIRNDLLFQKRGSFNLLRNF